MADNLETLEEQAERLKGALHALMGLGRSPQERLDRALSHFSRVFKYEPQGHALDPYQRIYRAIGEPPVGTTLSVPVQSLSGADQETIVSALIELYELLQTALCDARRTAGA